MESILNQLPCGVVQINEAGLITTINVAAEKQLAYAPDELLDQPFSQLLTIASRLLYQTHVYPLLNLHGRIEEVVLTLLTRKGERIPVLFNAARQWQDGQWLIHGAYLALGQRHHYEAELIQARQAAEAAQLALEQSEAKYRLLANHLEILVQERTTELENANTNLTQLNRDLTRSNDDLQQFTYIASHDLQEPLRKIQSFGSIVLQQAGVSLDDTNRFMLQRMVEAGSRMSTLVSDLLTFSRIATRQEMVDPVPMQAVVEAALDNLELMIAQTKAQLDVAELPTVKGDKSQLTQLFQNLIGNALKFTLAGQAPVVSITYNLRERDQLLTSIHLHSEATHFHHISVSDNGIGFDVKYLDRIFQVFQRLHGKASYSGTGIGLAICQRVIANHGGAITADSEVGKGTTFHVYLPV